MDLIEIDGFDLETTEGVVQFLLERIGLESAVD
jgi:hypothetical protein